MTNNKNKWHRFVTEDGKRLLAPSLAAKQATFYLKIDGRWACDSGIWHRKDGRGYWDPRRARESLYELVAEMLDSADVGYAPSYLKNVVKMLEIQGELKADCQKSNDARRCANSKGEVNHG